MFRTEYKGADVIINEGPLNSRMNSSFAELLDAIIWNRFGYRLAGGSYYMGSLYVGFDTGCAVGWQRSIADTIMTEFHIDHVFIDSTLYMQ